MASLKSRFHSLLEKYFKNKKILYLINGSLIFLINLILAYLIYKIPFSQNERIQNNIANLITTELMVFISFIIHNNLTWKGNTGKFIHKIFKYHTIMAVSILIRAVSFYLFDSIGFPFMVSTVLSIAIIVIFNFLGFDKFVFNKYE
ncbi:MAG: GtrA family protein [Leptospiraceae bacterium]|nr:GtrA family protein [Leptospiraceae bacterium]MDW7975266.1 GtrA family protein [Leptospiraceae bacterium]